MESEILLCMNFDLGLKSSYKGLRWKENFYSYCFRAFNYQIPELLLMYLGIQMLLTFAIRAFDK